MDVIYDIITENELKYFTDEDWELLESLLDDTLSVLVKNYLDSPDGDPEVKAACESHIGNTVRSYTFHLQVIEMNIVALVREVQPETVLLNPPEYLAELKEKFQFLRDNYSKLRTYIPARTSQNWNKFLDAMSEKPFASSAFMQGLKVNKQMFCSSREQERTLPTKYLLVAKNKWEMALNAILWDEKCKESGNTEYSLTGRLRFF